MTVTQVYMDNCSHCHGDNGEGGGAGSATLLTKELFDQAHDRGFFDAIKDGVPDRAMPAYGGVWPDNMIWGLVVHIRELQAKALRAKYGSPKPDAKGIYHSKHHNFKMETVIKEGLGLSTPWAIDWLPDGKMLITNRPGALVVFEKGALRPVEGVPTSIQLGQGGLLDITVHPDYKSNGWIYMAYAEPDEKGAAMTKIVRGKLVFGKRIRWTSQQTIFQAPKDSYNKSGNHFGSRIVFDGKRHIYFSIGERGQQDLAQDPGKPNGKIFRVNEDGTVPPDNPFLGGKGLPEVWSYGHRNPQGLAIDLNGNVFDTEHGPRGGDEFNLIKKGANYGWPKAIYSINYDDVPMTFPWPRDGVAYEAPLLRWLPSCATCGLAVVRGPKFGKWKGDLLAGGLAGKNLDRIRVKGGKVVEHEELLQGMGRVRDVAYGPDGAIYLVLNGPDEVDRLVEAP
ncbi:MAG: PQQ-dependent sugar dehydrogenase [Fimbriimonas ginsengisoli]|uniref:PQQ-dependent sugar dehydrogenase n=1 Tax=Fimbriimonas ginsengisoli TaxID=1005039 RepID=A0A931LRY2_FIMGI|nr:PQQ-dependent sugar dehydrogenase [Fimbriimonas ginsengisoli]